MTTTHLKQFTVDFSPFKNSSAIDNIHTSNSTFTYTSKWDIAHSFHQRSVTYEMKAKLDAELIIRRFTIFTLLIFTFLSGIAMTVLVFGLTNNDPSTFYKSLPLFLGSVGMVLTAAINLLRAKK